MPRRAVDTGQWPITVPRCMTVMVCVESEMFAVKVAAEAAAGLRKRKPDEYRQKWKKLIHGVALPV